MINFSKIKFIKSAPSYLDKPTKDLPEVLFVGKSNVGKSSLINALANNKNLAYTSSKPGFTKLLNYFEVDESFYLVDAPGYGYTSSGSRHLDSFSKMMENYFQNPNLKLVVFIVDSRHKLGADDVDFYNFVIDNEIPFILVASKIDKLNQSEKAAMKKNIASLCKDDEFVAISSEKKIGIDTLKNKINALVKH